MKFKIAKEVAEQEFERLCEANRIDHDTSELSEKDKEDFVTLRRDIVRDLQIGTLIVGDDGRVTYTPPGASSGFTFNSPTGATLIAGRSKTNDIEGMCLALAEMTRTDRGTFSKLHVKDFAACQRLFNLFLADA
jgi:hypothetical protein